MILFPWQKRKLRTLWRVSKEGRSGLLVGTAHFSPVSFHRSLIRLIRSVDTVIFEGPLDSESMEAVARYGRQAGATPSLYDALDPEVIRQVNALLAPRFAGDSPALPWLDLLTARTGFMEAHARDVRPWMAFFSAWTAFLDWKHSMDLEAFALAGRLGRRILYLETIADQLRALDGIPFERIVHYFNQYPRWNEHRERFTRVFLQGDPAGFVSTTGDFPTRCDAIFGRRDPLFFQGIRNAIAAGPAAAFVGIGHIPGLHSLFAADGYDIRQEGPC
jgi:hypothetical protein